MRRLMITVALTSALICAGSAGAHALKPLTGNEREARRAAILARIKENTPKRAEELLKPDSNPDVRDMTNTALSVLVAGQDPRIAEQLLIRAFSLQDMEANSPTFGYVPWRKGDEDIRRDPNSIEFATHSMGPILLLYADKLSESFKKEIAPHISAAFSALRLHHPPIWYTNIYLMNTANMILMGEAVGDKKAADDGYAQLDMWLEYTRKAGIHEYDSPTYYAVDLDVIAPVYLLAADPAGRAKIKAVLDYFYTDICANFFSATRRPSGPHSRNYDFLSGTGGLNPIYWLAGLIDKDPGGGSSYLYLASGENGYLLNEEILALASVPERVISSSWDTKPGGKRYSYMTPDFVIGSSSMSYEPQDRPIAIELASSKEMPVMSVIADSFDAPYGKARIVDGCGHNKPFHWHLNPNAVQEKGAMLLLTDPEPAKMKEIDSLAVNVLIPAQADSIWLDGEKVAVDAPFERVLSEASVVGVREGNAAVLMRVFFAEGCDGQKPALALKADESGLEWHTARCAIYSYRGAKKHLSESHARAAILLMAERCTSDAEFAELLKRAKGAEFSQQTKDGVWEAQVRLGALKLEVGHNLSDRQPAFRRVNGQEMDFGLLSINGSDMGKLLK